MSGDVDEGKWFACIDFIFFNMDTLAGWQYALKFHGAVWHGM